MTEETTTSPEAPEVAFTETPNDEPVEQVEQTQAAFDRRFRVLDHDFELPEEVPEEAAKRFKDIADSLNKGWTTKNQSLAEEKRQLAAWQQQEAQRLQQQQAAIEKVAELKALDNQLKAYNDLTPEQWSQWAEQDSQGAQRAFMQWQALKEKRNGVDGEVRQFQTQQQQQHQYQLQQFIEMGQKVLAEKAPDLTQDLKQGIVKSLADDYGINGSHPLDESVTAIANLHPGLVLMARDAYLYRQSLKKATAPQPKPQPEPVGKVGQNASQAKSPDKMSDKEWIEWRSKQLARKRA